MKYFISYTTRDNYVSTLILKEIAEKIKKIGDVYIDILDNDSDDKQARVIDELDNSDVLILLETNNVYNSEWVSFELNRAKEKNIPIKILSINDIIALSETELHSKIESGDY